MKKFFHDYILHNIAFFIFSTAAICLLVASFIVPPTGIIDPSVLAAVGELFGFAGLDAVILAIEKGTSAKVSHNSTTITVNEKEDKNQNRFS